MSTMIPDLEYSYSNAFEEDTPSCEGRTTLFNLITNRNWDKALAQLDEKPAEAKVWTECRGYDGELDWKHLPIHEACYRNPPLTVIEKLLKAYPDGSKEKDLKHRLPIHYAALFGTSLEVIKCLLKNYPESVNVKDCFGKTPIRCIQKQNSQSRYYDVMIILQETKTNEEDEIQKDETQIDETGSSNAGTSSHHVKEKILSNVSTSSVKVDVVASKEDKISFSKQEKEVTASTIKIKDETKHTNQKLNTNTSTKLNGITVGPKTSNSEHNRQMETDKTIIDGSILPTRIEKNKNTACEEKTSHDYNAFEEIIPSVEACTNLFKLIQDKQWDQVLRRINHNVTEASTWTTQVSHDGELNWKRLPIHEVCLYNPPLSVIEALVRAYDNGVEAKDLNGRLPIHHAAVHGASLEVMEFLLDSFPESVKVTDNFGKTPSMCLHFSPLGPQQFAEISRRMTEREREKIPKNPIALLKEKELTTKLSNQLDFALSSLRKLKQISRNSDKVFISFSQEEKGDVRPDSRGSVESQRGDVYTGSQTIVSLRARIKKRENALGEALMKAGTIPMPTHSECLSWENL